MLITGTLPARITLRTIAPSVLEGTCLLIIFTVAVSLAIPFVSSHIDILFEKSKKLKGNLNGIKILETPPTTNSPSFSPLPSAAPIHSPYPKPVNRSSKESMVDKGERCTVPVLSEVVRSENPGSKFHPISYGSGLVSYDSYRHKLIEETLRKQYGGGYAPGNVILNLIELNTADSGSSLILSKKYDGNFFDDVKIADAVIALCKNSDSRFDRIEFADPLTHFIPRNSRKPSTTEINTETASPSEISVALEPSAMSSARPNTPSSCQRIIPKRSREANYPFKSPFPTPAHSQAPLIVSQKSDSSASGRGEAVNLLQNVLRAPPTEQLYKRNDTRPDVVSRTHVEAEEYLDRIAKKKRDEIGTTIQRPRIRSSLKKSGHRACGGKKFPNDDPEVVDDRTGDGAKIRKSVRNLSTSRPTIWNN